MKTMLLPILLLAFPGVAAAQAPDTANINAVRPLDHDEPFDLALSVTARRVFTGGDDVTIDGLGYGDLFRDGWGVRVEGAAFWHLHDFWRAGGYISLGYETFDGRSATNSVGERITPDSLDITSFFVGGVAEGRMLGGFSWQAYVGIGLATYASCHATIVSGGTTFTDQEFLAATPTLAYEFGLRVGIGGPRMAIVAGIGFEVLGGPDPGSDVNPFSVDPLEMVNFELELGAIFRF